MTKTESTPQTQAKAGWGQEEKAAWLAEQVIHRSYEDDVLQRLEKLRTQLGIQQYGALSYSPKKYPLLLAKTKGWTSDKQNILVTGGVHGYETSGVHGALAFLELLAREHRSRYQQRFNFIVAPCVSPWAYETINRWNPKATDPNRSFYVDSPAEESAALMTAIRSLNEKIFAHFDLHETTDTDNTVFRPALAARDGVEQDIWSIPDGFYLVGDVHNPADDFQQAIIKSVSKVTHIAPPDDNGRIIGEPTTQAGVINYATKKLGLCTGFSGSQYCTTTEVYPDSPRVSAQECVDAQVAAIKGGLEYLLQH